MNHQNTQAQAHLVSWKSVAAGFLVTLFTMTALLGLGMAFGSIGLDDETSAKGASVFTGIWFLVSTLVSIFVGSYYSARLSAYRVPKVGAANGLLIACLFILFFLIQAFSAIGTIGRSAGTLVGNMAIGATEMAARNPQSTGMVANYVEEQFMNLELRSSPQVVASGVASRVINGNFQGAQNYLAYQANISSADAQARVAQLRAEASRLVDEAKAAAATALKATGWSLFFLIFFSTIAAIIGGYLGSRTNIAHPITDDLGLFKTRYV